MITSLRLVNFKNFADETLHLGPFTLIVGANASGKSNIRDAFRFLHGVGGGYTVTEILGGKYSAEWPPIRGAPNEIARFGQHEFSLEIEVRVTRRKGLDTDCLRHTIHLSRGEEPRGRYRVVAESLTKIPKPSKSSDSSTVYSSDPPPGHHTGVQRENSQLRLRVPIDDEPAVATSDQPALSQSLMPLKYRNDEDSDSILSEEYGTQIAWLRTDLLMLRVSLELRTMRFFELMPDRLREPSLPGPPALGDFGDHLPTVLQGICADPKRKSVLLSWLHDLTPMDVSDLEFPVDLNGRVNLRIVEANGRKISAYSASDGTLRFLGMLAALLNEHFEGLYFFEEIDNGIHPARLHLLLDLIERQTAKGKIQVIATTHSPDVLNLINDKTFENSVVVYRDEDSADAVIRRVAELPNARELRKSQGLGRLHVGGWMENILSFAEAETKDKKGGE